MDLPRLATLLCLTSLASPWSAVAQEHASQTDGLALQLNQEAQDAQALCLLPLFLDHVPRIHQGDPHDLALGDFNGDGVPDLFTADGESWFLSSNGVEEWVHINSSSFQVADLGFAEFDGDGVTDVFRANGSEWLVSYGAINLWQRLNTSRATAVHLGDFDGDGRADVFHANGSEWLVSYGGNSRWAHLNRSGVTTGLRFGDFDGDGRTDVFRTNGHTWFISFGGVASWTRIADSSSSLDDLYFGDFDGDGRTDILLGDPADAEGRIIFDTSPPVVRLIICDQFDRCGWYQSGGGESGDASIHIFSDELIAFRVSVPVVYEVDMTCDALGR